jgi:hypothetical protein
MISDYDVWAFWEFGILNFFDTIKTKNAHHPTPNEEKFKAELLPIRIY